jgi:hypothetical protein
VPDTGAEEGAGLSLLRVFLSLVTTLFCFVLPQIEFPKELCV